MLEYQKAFDYVLDRMIAQDGQCSDMEGTCLFNGPSDRHCAVGWLLDLNPLDAAATLDSAIPYIQKRFGAVEGGQTGDPDGYKFLRAIMSLHDQNLFWNAYAIESHSFHEQVQDLQSLGVDTTALVALAQRNKDKAT